MKLFNKVFLMACVLSAATSVVSLPPIPINDAINRVDKLRSTTHFLIDRLRVIERFRPEDQDNLLLVCGVQLHRLDVEKRTMDAYLYIKLTRELGGLKRRLQKSLDRVTRPLA
jgi:hypothetical protein